MSVQIAVIGANDLYKTEHLSRMDPYVIVRVGQQKAETAVKREAGRNPTFNETFNFSYGGEHQIFFDIFDKETMRSNRFVGAGSYDALSARTDTNATIDLYRVGEEPVPAGKLQVKIRALG
eukprot:Trichotokara_eunicae@DN5061_c0_g1_i1.p1